MFFTHIQRWCAVYLLSCWEHRGFARLGKTSRACRADIVEMLLDAGADPEPFASGGWSALSAACAGGHHRTVQYLLDADADPDEVDDSGRTLLHDAAEDGRWDIVRQEKKWDQSGNSSWGEGGLLPRWAMIMSFEILREFYCHTMMKR